MTTFVVAVLTVPIGGAPYSQLVPKLNALGAPVYNDDLLVAFAAYGNEREGFVAVRNDRLALGGTLFLQNRSGLERMLACKSADLSDHELVLAVLTAHGVTAIRRVVGEFALVVIERQS